MRHTRQPKQRKRSKTPRWVVTMGKLRLDSTMSQAEITVALVAYRGELAVTRAVLQAQETRPNE